MKHKIPKTSIMGTQVEGAIERVLAERTTPSTQPEQPLQHSDISEKEGFIYIPSIQLYVAKEKSLPNLTWQQTHEELHKQSQQMLTLYQFIQFILHLQQNQTQEHQTILEEILTKRSPWRGEHLDALFTEENQQMFITYGHQTINGELKGTKEPLQPCLTESCYADIFQSANQQGIPTQKSQNQDLYFWKPRNNRVGGFDANSVRASLYCIGNPSSTVTGLGVRVAQNF